MKKFRAIIVLFMLFGICSIMYYNKTYLNENTLAFDIQNRINTNYKNGEMTNWKVLKQKDVDNLSIVLSSYTINNLNLVDCSVYEKIYNQRYKFIRGQQAVATGTMIFSMGKQNKTNFDFIHFGYISDNVPNKFEITYGNKTFINEYNRNESVLELYDLQKDGPIGIRPIYENKVIQ